MSGASGHGGGGRGWRFNPFEIAVCGHDGEGKTTLLEGITRALAGELSVARAGSTDRAGDRPDLLAPYSLLAADAVLVDGQVPAVKDAAPARIVLVDRDVAPLQDPTWAQSPPSAIVHPFSEGSVEEHSVRSLLSQRLGGLPLYALNDVAGVAGFVRAHWKARIPKLRGLVLTGGESRRMGQDKALLRYHGCTQIDYGVGLLGEVCTDVAVSCRAEQSDESHRRRHPVLVDRFLDMGPTSGLLTALASDPDSAWLVLACDLPRVDAGVLRHLVAARNPFRFATAFRGDDGFPEPLCTLWEPKAYPRLLQFLGMGYTCPRKCLINSRIELIQAPLPHALDNGNSPHDVERIRDDLHPGS